jgi:hypothetical protein
MKFSVNVNDLTCMLQDSEYNSFEIDMLNPLDPEVSLAGEVDGLKPSAVTDKPIEPRLFIVSRNAEAVELLTQTSVDSFERAVDRNRADCYKLTTGAHSEPYEVGNVMLHTYFTKKRRGSEEDSYGFADVYMPRPWVTRQKPCTATLAMASDRLPGVSAPILQDLNQDSHDSFMSNSEASSPRHSAAVPVAEPNETGANGAKGSSDVQEIQPKAIFETINVTEYPTLTPEGYQKLLDGFERWDDFCNKRVESIDRFKVEDMRSAEDLEQEEKVKQRLKHAYRHAKQQLKRKEPSQRVSKKLISESKSAAPVGAFEGKLDHNLGDIAEGDEDAGDDEEDEEPEFSDDESDGEDPDELEIRAAFEEFSLPNEIVKKTHPNKRRVASGSKASPSTASLSLPSGGIHPPVLANPLAFDEVLDSVDDILYEDIGEDLGGSDGDGIDYDPTMSKLKDDASKATQYNPPRSMVVSDALQKALIQKCNYVVSTAVMQKTLEKLALQRCYYLNYSEFRDVVLTLHHDMDSTSSPSLTSTLPNLGNPVGSFPTPSAFSAAKTLGYYKFDDTMRTKIGMVGMERMAATQPVSMSTVPMPAMGGPAARSVKVDDGAGYIPVGSAVRAARSAQ